jgi:hypothetical protein
MNQIFQVTIHGRTLESRNLKQLLARAVSVKRSIDHTNRVFFRTLQSRELGDQPRGFGQAEIAIIEPQGVSNAG